MATITIFAELSDGTMTSEDAVYATARAGTGTLTLGFSNDHLSVGQVPVAPYHVYQSYLSFDTSTVSSVDSASLSLYGINDGSTQDFTTEARLYDFGTSVTTADFVPGDSLSSLPLLVTFDTAAFVNDYNVFTDSALAPNLNLTGSTRMVLCSDRTRLNTVPIGAEWVQYRNADSVGTTNDPKLVITADSMSADNILNPDGDIVTNSWTTETDGTTELFISIDEAIASDTDYIQSPAGPTTAQYYETALQTKADPLSSSGHIAHYRYQKNVAGGGIDLRAMLCQAPPVSITQSLGPDEFAFGNTATSMLAQSFVAPEGAIASVTLSLNKTGSPTDNLAVTIQSSSAGKPSGIDLVSLGSIPGTTLTTSAVLYTFYPTTTYVLTPGTIYWIVLARTGALNDTHDYMAMFDNTVHADAFGFRDGGTGVWTTAFSALLFTVSFDKVIAFWTHTNIANSWVTQDQTLSGPEADSITDYSDLRLRFTPDMTTSDQTAPVPTKVADRASANSNTAVTTVDLVLTGLTVGNYLIIRSAADNSGGGGAARSITLSNLVGTPVDLATDQVFQQNNDPGAASAGVTCNVGITKILNTSGTVRMTYSGSVVQACVAEEWSGLHATTPIVGTPVGANGVNSLNLASLAEVSVAAGNAAYAAMAVEGPSSDVYVQDTDTTNGTWSDLTKVGTTIATAISNQTTWGGYKVVTATGAQTHNATIGVLRDSAGLILELAAAAPPAPTIKAQVSWANLELPAATSVPRSFGAQVGLALEALGAVAFGAGDA